MTTELSSDSAASDPRLPAHVRVADDLMRRIRSGEWTADAPLPPERHLADEYSISTGTMRKVLSELVTNGYIERVQGRGTFVRRGDFSKSFIRFFRPQSRGQVPEGQVLSTAILQDPTAEPETATSATGTSAAYRQRELRDAAAALRLGAGAELIYLERLRRIDGAVVLSEHIYLPAMTFGQLKDLAPGDFPNLLYPLFEQAAGQTVTRAFEQLTVDSAHESDVELLGVEPHSPIVQIERVATNINETPLEYRISRGRPDGFSYRMEIK